MEVLIGILCFILGYVVARIIFRVKTIGTLVVDESDPEDGPYMFLELSVSPHDVKRMKKVSMKVSVKNYISQK